MTRYLNLVAIAAIVATTTFLSTFAHGLNVDLTNKNGTTHRFVVKGPGCLEIPEGFTAVSGKTDEGTCDLYKELSCFSYEEDITTLRGAKVKEFGEITLSNAESLALSPAMQHIYGNMIHHVPLSNKGFIVVRPFMCLDFVGLVLTTPGAEQTPAGFASQMGEAFQPRSHHLLKQRRVSDFAWGPPMALALEMAEYLTLHVRCEADLEGCSEAQMIEQLTAQLLTSWMGDVVITQAGGVLCKAKGQAAV
ncbi:hypothetical protein DFQ26_002613 [Actinomortierella ambigua]|nr:hypothetical protein DFQ26_002613 [Actinomortierella ambigua]